MNERFELLLKYINTNKEQVLLAIKVQRYSQVFIVLIYLLHKL